VAAVQGSHTARYLREALAAAAATSAG
jgi:hypothetical protein